MTIDDGILEQSRSIEQEYSRSYPNPGLLDIEEEDWYPDGGRDAWLVVVGAWCAMIPSMGLLNTIGVLQAWVEQNQLHDYSESEIGWIFSAYAFFLYIAGAQIGRGKITIDSGSVC